jgi:hypothetical protein
MANPSHISRKIKPPGFNHISDTMAFPGVYEACGLAFHVSGIGFDDI